MLELKLHPSRTLTALLAGAHLLSVLVIWRLPLAPATQIASSLLIAASLLFHLRRDGLLAAGHSIIALRLDPECNFFCQTRDGSWQEAKLLGSSMVTPWLIVLNFTPEKKWLVRHAVILPDSADTELLRQLRVLLRWKCGNASRA
ncbi:MAG: hypothetical protein K8H84_09445 [Sulfuricella denitrificans]|nr:hypothetical protein [Sulfuricella denitrificans]